MANGCLRQMAEPHALMREKFDLVRELGRGAFGEARSAGEAWRSWALYFGIATAGGVFLAFVGAFGTDAAPTLLRLAYWIPAMMLGSLIGQASARLTGAYLGDVQPWVRTSVIAFSVAVVATGAIWVATGAMLGAYLRPSGLLSLFWMVLGVSVVMSALFMLVGQARTRRTEAGPTPPRFLERFPAKLRGAALYAVEAEDHYLRLHTSKGQDLVLMRLGDAITELDGLEGAQTHRSWWVARNGVADVKRADGKVWLQLHDGADAPVSRGNLKALREAGWL